jgi:mannose-6-phosphate isomerase-like protein (cupin superfamily)
MVIDTTNAKHYIWGEVCDGWHLLESDELSIIQEKVPAGKSEKRHYHNFSKQFFYILKGVATIEINGIFHELTSGQGIEIPPKTPHQFINQSDKDVDFIVVSTPKSHGDRVEVL